MRRIALIVMGGVCLAACQQDTKGLERKVDDLAAAVARIEQKMDGLAAAAPARPRTPPKRVEPDAADVYAIPVEGAASVGPADALVTVVKGYEYACPYCEKVNPTIAQLRAQYGDDLRVVYKHFLVHPAIATEPALAVCAATRQGKFQEMDRLVWEQAYAVRKFDRATMEALAGQAGLDLARFRADIDGPCTSIIAGDQSHLQAAGQRATPTFFINGRYLSGAQPLARFQALIDAELVTARARVAAGTPRADYYRTWVLDKGLKKFTPKPEAGAAGGQPPIQVRQGGAPPAQPPPGAQPKAEKPQPPAPGK